MQPGVRRARTLLWPAAVLVAAMMASSAAAAVSVPAGPVASNPAERLVALPIEPSVYEPASRCLPNTRRPGTRRFVAWLKAGAAGTFWGDYRCKKWGEGKASLHAERRAVDWHLDASRSGDRREAQRLIALLTAPDSAGNSHALARRMGVEEIIWDCRYWAAGMASFRAYSPCLDRTGRTRRQVNRTIAHRDHIHFGLTRNGSLASTSFWRQEALSAPSATPVPRRRRSPRPGPSPDVAPAPGGGMQIPAALP